MTTLAVLGILWSIAIVCTLFFAGRTVLYWKLDDVLRMNVANGIQVSLMITILVLFLLGVFNG